VQWVDVQSVTEMPRQFQVEGIDTRNVEFWRGSIQGSRCKVVRTERDIVEFALVVHVCFLFPGVPEVTEDLDVLSQAGSRPFPLEIDREPTLHVALDLRPQSDHEPATRDTLEVPGGVGSHHGTPWECHRDG
jgi:hypothetical protein